MVCWICGAANLSGEHIPKASNLRSLFGVVTSNNPLFFNGRQKRNKRIQSINSTYLKYRQICTNCNNNLTQKYDEAWDDFFEFLQENKDLIRVGSGLSKAKIFGCNAKKKQIYLQLYLLKVFGTFCAEQGVPIDFQGIGRSIKIAAPYRNFYFGIAKRSWLNHIKLVAGSHIHFEIDPKTGRADIAIQIMNIDGWEFELIYVSPSNFIRKFPSCWNPLISNKFIIKCFNKKLP